MKPFETRFGDKRDRPAATRTQVLAMDVRENALPRFTLTTFNDTERTLVFDMSQTADR